MAALILMGIAVSMFAHRHQQRKEARERTIQQLLGESVLLGQLLTSMRAVPLPLDLYQHLTKTYGKLAIQLRQLDPTHPELKGLAETLVTAEENPPPDSHIAFPPGITHQLVQRDLKYLQSFVQKQFSHSLTQSNDPAWKEAIANLRLDVEREYFVRACEQNHSNGQKREAAQAINHALKLVGKATHLSKEIRQQETDRLKEIKRGLSGSPASNAAEDPDADTPDT